MLNLLFLVCGALGWAYVTAQIVDIIVNANPDATAFKNRMDDLNRYVGFYELKPDVAQRLREYFYETRYTRAAEARREIVSELSTDLQEEITSLVNNKWLSTVAFFRGMTTPEGVVVAPPAEGAFLAKVAVALQSTVYAPIERPPPAGCTSSTRARHGTRGCCDLEWLLVGRLGRDAAERAARQARRRHHLPPRAVGRRPDAARDRRRLFRRRGARCAPGRSSTGCASTCSISCGRRATTTARRRKSAVRERRKPGNLLRKASKKILAFSLAGVVGAPAAAGAAKRAPRPRRRGRSPSCTARSTRDSTRWRARWGRWRRGSTNRSRASRRLRARCRAAAGGGERRERRRRRRRRPASSLALRRRRGGGSGSGDDGGRRRRARRTAKERSAAEAEASAVADQGGGVGRGRRRRGGGAGGGGGGAVGQRVEAGRLLDQGVGE